jgi:hypothetical protein
MLAAGSVASSTAVWLTAANLGLYVQLNPVHIRLRAQASLPIRYSVVSGTLPGALTLNPINGVISGVMPAVTADTDYSFVVTANTSSIDSLRQFHVKATLLVETEPVWQTPPGLLGTGNSGQIFTATLLAIDPNQLPIGYRLVANSALPDGLRFNIATGQLLGVLPAVAVDTPFAFTVNATNGFFSVPRSFAIIVLLEQTINWQTPAGSLSTQLQNTTFLAVLNAASRDHAAISYQLAPGSEPLPPGVTLDPPTGTLYGTLPFNTNVNGDTYNFIIEASNTVLTAARTFSITSLTTTAAVDPFATTLILLMHMDGDNGSANFVDTTGNPVIALGHPQISAVQSLFGGASASFDGASRLNVTPVRAHDFDLSATDFSIEYAVLFTTVPSVAVTQIQASNGNLVIGYDGQGHLRVSATANTSTTVTDLPWQPFARVWSRVAVVNANSVTTVYLDGEAIGNTALSLRPGGARTAVSLGGGTTSAMMTGYLDEVRITRAARYLDTYTPADRPCPDVPYWITTSLPPAISEQPYLTPLLGNDPNGNGLTFARANASVLPLFLNTTPAGSIEGVTGYVANVTTATFTLVLTDGFNPVQQTLSLQILDNPPPTLGIGSPIGLGTYVAGWPVTARIAATSLRAVVLTYHASDLTALTGLVLDPDTGAITGTAPPTPPANSTVVFIANVVYGVSLANTAQAVSANYAISFEHDFPPVWQSVTLRTQSNAITIAVPSDNTLTTLYSGVELSTLPSTTLLAIDPNRSQTISYSLAGGLQTLPPALSLAGNHIEGTLASVDANTTTSFTLIASDGRTDTAARFAIEVIHLSAPIWVSAAGALAAVIPGTPYQAAVQAIDGNHPALPLSYRLTGRILPPGLTLDATSGVVSGLQTGVAASAAFTFVITADNGGKSTAQTFSIFVPIDHGIVWITPQGEISNTVTGAPISLSVQAISLDASVPRYSLTGGSLPDTLHFIADDGASGAGVAGFGPSVPASAADQLSYTGFAIAVTADNGVTALARNFAIAVGNCLPIWITPNDLGQFWGGQPALVALAASFNRLVLQPPPLRYFLLSSPLDIAPLTIDAASGNLAGHVPDVSANSVISFVANATDGVNAAIRTFMFTTVVSTPPIWQTPQGALLSTIASNAIVWTTPADLGSQPAETDYRFELNAQSGQFSYHLMAIDPQNLPLAFSTQDVLPGTLHLNPTTGAISGTLTRNEVASFTITIDDGIKSSSQIFSVSGDANINPLIFRLTATNPSVTAFTYTADGAVLSGRLPPVTANLTSYSVTVEADNGLPAEQQTRVFTVDSLYPYPSWVTPNGVIYTALGDTVLPSGLANAIHVAAVSPVGRTLVYTIDSRANLPPGIVQGVGLPGALTAAMANAFYGIAPEVLVANTWHFVMTADDGHLPPITAAFAMDITVNPDLSWQTPSGSIGSVFGGLTYSNDSILANSATGRITYAITAGGLPGSVGIANATPAQGTPITLSGLLANADVETTFNFVVSARTDAGFSIQRAFSIDVLINTLIAGNSDFRDVYCDDVVLLLHGEGVDKARVYYDEILHRIYPVVQAGAVNEPGPYLSTIRARCGLTSLYLDGHTAVATADAPEFDLSRTDWTLECSLYFETLPTKSGTIFSCTTCWITYDITDSQQRIIVHYTPLINAKAAAAAQAIFPVVLLASIWHNLALVRGDASLSLFINASPSGQIAGVPDFYTPMMDAHTAWQYPLCLGCRATISQPGGFLAAYVDEVRLTRAARYTSGYVISPYPFPSPPAFRQSPGRLASVLGGVQALVPLTATDPYHQGLQFFLGNGALPPPMNVLANGLIEGTPDNPTTDTDFTFALRVTDGVNPVTRSFSILDKLNFPPVWSTPAGPIATIVSGLDIGSLTVLATDRENYPLTYQIINGGGIAPPGTTLDSATGRFIGVSTLSVNTQQFNMTIAASDGVTPVNRSFSILSMGNQPPIWTTPPGQRIDLQSGAYLALVLVATDVNQQPITYRVISVSPPTTFTLDPRNGTLGGYQAVVADRTFDFVIGAANQVGETSLAIAIRVSPSLPPLVANAVFTGLGGLPAAATVLATDPQNLGLTFFMGNPALPPPLAIDGVSGAIRGTLPNPIGGHTYPFTIVVSNQAQTSRVTDSFVVTYNLQPVWQVGTNLGSYSGMIAIPITARDPENYPVTYSFEGGNTPPGTRYDPASGYLSGILALPSAGDEVWTFSLGASDGVQKNVQTFSLTNQYSGVPLFQTTTPLPAAYLNQGYSFAFTMKNNLTP